MKHSILLLLTVILAASCSNKTVDKLFTHYKKDESVIAATIPGWLVEKGLHFALKQESIEELHDVQKVVRNIKKLRLLVSSDMVESAPVKNLSANLRKEKYELFGMVNNRDAKVNIWIQENSGRVKDVFLYVKSDEYVVLLQVKGDIDMNALEKVDVNKLNQKA